MHPLASKFIVGNPISPKQVYNVFLGGGGGGGYQGWIQDFFPLGVDTGFFHWGVVTRDGYGIFPLGGGWGYQGWIRDFSIGGWGVTKPSGSKNDYNNVYLEVP